MNSSLHKALAGVGIALGVVATVALAIWGYSEYQQASNYYPPRTVTFNGKATVTVVPDYAEVIASVITQNASAQQAQSENDAKVQKLRDFIKSRGVEDKDIQTVGYNLYPQYDYDYCRREDPNNTGYCPPKIVSYEMSQSLQFRVRNLDTLGTLLGAVTEQGANTISGVQFKLEDVDAVRQQAIAEAIEKAQEKAQAYQEAVGIKLGKIITLSESGGDVFYGGGYYADGKGGAGAVMSSPVEAGSQDVSLEVYLTYEIK